MPETFDWFTIMKVSGLQHAAMMFLMLHARLTRALLLLLQAGCWC
jgi:hypothetical protein